MSRIGRHRAVLVLLGLGLALRLVLALVVFPGQGLSSDLGFFEGWATTLARVGPGGFYATASSANYPPGYMYVLWLVGVLGSLAGSGAAHATLLLLKIPAILADIGIGALLYVAGRRWFGPRAGLLAAALYLFNPVAWYDSALWGQVDAVGAFIMLAALVLLVEGWSEPAAALAAFSLLVKPQDAIILVVIVPVLLRRHLLRPGSGPIPSLGPRLARLNERIDGLFVDQGPRRLATSLAAAAIVGIVPLIPFDISRDAPASLADVPVISHVAGLIGMFASDGGQFSYLTANAYNAWALVGANPLASIIGGAGGSVDARFDRRDRRPRGSHPWCDPAGRARPAGGRRAADPRRSAGDSARLLPPCLRLLRPPDAGSRALPVPVLRRGTAAGRGGRALDVGLRRGRAAECHQSPRRPRWSAVGRPGRRRLSAAAASAAAASAAAVGGGEAEPDPAGEPALVAARAPVARRARSPCRSSIWPEASRS